MKPSIGRIVHYTLSENDATAIANRRKDFGVNIGNAVREGDVFPAVIVRVFEAAGSANLKVLLDGTDDFWAGSVSEGEGPRTWAWPPRV